MSKAKLSTSPVKTETLTVRLSSETKAELIRKADAAGMSATLYLEFLIRNTEITIHIKGDL